jgi:hypothetical protein
MRHRLNSRKGRNRLSYIHFRSSGRFASKHRRLQVARFPLSGRRIRRGVRLQDISSTSRRCRVVCCSVRRSLTSHHASRRSRSSRIPSEPCNIGEKLGRIVGQSPSFSTRNAAADSKLARLRVASVSLAKRSKISRASAEAPAASCVAADSARICFVRASSRTLMVSVAMIKLVVTGQLC